MKLRKMNIISELESAKRITKDGTQYWHARDIQPVLGYVEWRHFQSVIERAKMACEGVGADYENHFVGTAKMVDIGSGTRRRVEDYFLSRYACYLIAMNGDSNKPQIGFAQTYFAIQTRRMELLDQQTEQLRRLQLRDRVRNANKQLAGAAKAVGVQRYAVFQDAGYRGLYDMRLAQIKDYKRIDGKENLLDRAGRAELDAAVVWGR